MHINIRTAAHMMEVSLPTMRKLVREIDGLGSIVSAASENENDKYQVDTLALFFIANGAVDELDRYRNGRIDPDHAQSVRSALGIGAHGGDDMTKRYPLLIEFARPYVAGDVRRSIFRIAEARNMTPLEVLIAGFDAAKADAALQENVS